MLCPPRSANGQRHGVPNPLSSRPSRVLATLVKLQSGQVPQLAVQRENYAPVREYQRRPKPLILYAGTIH